MAKYLTSGKIALLALVSLYAESRFPNQSILPVLTFVLQHLVSSKNNPTFIVTLEQLKTATINQQSAITGRTVFDLLLKKLWEINSYDALHEFITSLQELLADPKDTQKLVRVDGQRSYLTKTSVLGCFVRRAALEFVRLQFHESLQLWQSFIQFREPTLTMWRKRNPSAGPLSFDSMLDGMSMDDALVQHLYGRLGDIKDGMLVYFMELIYSSLKVQLWS